jgi:hypothetical protein
MAAKTLVAKIKDLEKKVKKLQDIEDIQRLQKAYGYYIEHWMSPELANLFADGPDTVLSVMGGTYIGKESVARYINGVNTGQNPEFVHQMMLLSGIVDVDTGGRTAEGRWYGYGAVAFPMGAGVMQVVMCGIYTAQYIKQGGRWRIKKLQWDPLFVSPPGEGWVKKERLGAVDHNYQSRFPAPDKPREIDPRYPTGYIVPFHFKHPVTGKNTTEDKRNLSLKKGKKR